MNEGVKKDRFLKNKFCHFQSNHWVRYDWMKMFKFVSQKHFFGKKTNFITFTQVIRSHMIEWKFWKKDRFLKNKFYYFQTRHCVTYDWMIMLKFVSEKQIVSLSEKSLGNIWISDRVKVFFWKANFITFRQIIRSNMIEWKFSEKDCFFK